MNFSQNFGPIYVLQYVYLSSFVSAILYNIATQVTVPSYQPERGFITGDENIRKFRVESYMKRFYVLF